MNESPNPTKKRLLLALKLGIAGVVAVFIVLTIRDASSDLAEYALHVRPGWFLLAGALYVAGLAPCGLFWHRTLRTLGHRPGLARTMRAYFVGHLGKYVPGKAMVVVLRAGMIRDGVAHDPTADAGFSPAAAALSVVYETLTMMAVGAFLAAVLLATRFDGLADQRFFLLVSLALLAVSVAPTLPGVFQRLARLIGVGRDAPHMTDRLARLSYPSLAWGWLTIAVGWVLIGASLWATLRGMNLARESTDTATFAAYLPSLESLLVCTAVVSLAMVAGFLSLIPGGALVRESVIVALLTGAGYSQADALIAAVLLRLVWLIAELAAAGVSVAARPVARPSVEH